MPLSRPISTASRMLLIGCLAGCLAGCGSGDGAAAPVPTSPTSTAPSASTSTEPTSTPTVTPASGPLIHTDHVSLRAPKGFSLDTSFGSTIFASAPVGSDDTVVVGDLPYLVSDTTLQDVEKNVLTDRHFTKNGRVLPRITVGGVTMSHVVGRDITDNEEFDAILPGHQGVTILFELDTDDSKAHQRQLISSVLASVQWK